MGGSDRERNEGEIGERSWMNIQLIYYTLIDLGLPPFIGEYGVSCPCTASVLHSLLCCFNYSLLKSNQKSSDDAIPFCNKIKLIRRHSIYVNNLHSIGYFWYGRLFLVLVDPKINPPTTDRARDSENAILNLSISKQLLAISSLGQSRGFFSIEEECFLNLMMA